MTLSDLASLGGFVSGVAVVVTLVFLVIQMRQTNANQRAMMQQMRSARTIDTILRHAEPGLNDTISTVMRGESPLNDLQIRSFLVAIDATLFNWEDSFLQRQAGTLDAEAFESDKNGLRDYAAVPAFRVAWRMTRKYFTDGYREFGDAIMHEVKVAPPPDLKSMWETMMAEELAAIGK